MIANRTTSTRISIAALAVLAVLVLLSVVGMWIPLSAVRFTWCPYCRTSMEYRQILGVTTYERQRQSDFTAYYLTKVEPGHVHSWMDRLSCATYTLCRRHGHISAPPIGLFRSDMLISILDSFTTTAERRAFVTKFCACPSPTEENALQLRLMETQESLNALYRADPNRRDWPEKLAELGLWP